MTLNLYNTLTRKKEEFIPLKKGSVGLYCCGVTVYDSCHLGHARAALTFDVMVRYLRFLGYDVTYVRNYTDVDDKIIARANERGISTEELTAHYISEYERDMKALGLMLPTKQPKATEHIQEMITMIEKLIANGTAYVVDGDVFFSVRSFSGYGKLSGKKIEELESGARVEVDEKKRDPLDFALWKASKPGEPKWKSPWSEGRPGWHIECSAMSTKYLGQPFDLHGGGRDLQFPHHENEIAQAEAAEKKAFARYWLHNGFININAEKMSKSLGNITPLHELLQHYHHEVIRLFILSNHYRSPIDYTEKGMAETRTSLDRFYETAARVMAAEKGKEEGEFTERLERFEHAFCNSMNDDFNTAAVMGEVFEIVRIANKTLDQHGGLSHNDQVAFQKMCKLLGDVIGIFASNPQAYREKSAALIISKSGVNTAEVERLIAQRSAARRAKDFKRSDALRDELAKMGIILKDRPDGTTEWKFAYDLIETISGS